MQRKQTEKRGGSKSPSRRSRSRSRSRGRSRSPARTKAKASPSPVRKPRSPARQTKVKTPSTPTRTSARIAVRAEKQEVQELQKELEDKTQENNVKTPLPSPPVVKTTEKKNTKSLNIVTPLLATFALVLLPVILLFNNLACTKDSCTVKSIPKIPRDVASYFNAQAFGVLLGWVAFQCVLSLLPIGPVVEGQPTPSGDRLKYRCNGFYAFVGTLAAVTVASYLNFPLSFVYQHFLHLMVAAIVFATVLSVVAYFLARRASGRRLSSEGNTGCTPVDFLKGRELNPRCGPVDLKVFSLRVGLSSWNVVNLCFLLESYRNTNQIDMTLAILVAFQLIYAADNLWFEEAALTQMALTKEAFGFMFAFGAYCWFPFLHTLQARFLLEHPQTWTYATLAGFCLLNLVGYVIYRGSNSQKDQFRRNPHDPALSYLESIPSPSGRSLLVSGWWGLVRHPNYLGDLLMALAWSLPCGYSHILPYTYLISLAFLLTGRVQEDDVLCRKKHSLAWERYCQRVPYKLIPYIY